MFLLGIFGNFLAIFHYFIKGSSVFHFYTFKGMCNTSFVIFILACPNLSLTIFRNKLTDEADILNYFLYLECLSYTRNCANMINSDLKEETKIDLIINEFVNGGIEEELYKSMNE